MLRDKTFTLLVIGFVSSSLIILAILAFMNTFALPKTATEAVASSKDTQVVEVAEPTQAQIVSQEILEKFPTKTYPFRDILDEQQGFPWNKNCPNDKEATPVVSKGQYSNKEKTGVAHVRVFSPGLGQESLKKIINNATDCGATLISDNNLNNAGIRFNNTDTYLTRHADILTSTTGKSSPAIKKTHTKWDTAWKTLPNLEKCTATSDNPHRNPTNDAFTGKQITETAELNPNEKLAAHTAAVIDVNLNATPIKGIKSGTLPTKQGKQLTDNITQLPNYPSDIYVNLPDKPEIMSPPNFPTQTETEKNYSQRVPDPFGPGCGWKFTGFTPPVFNEPTINTLNQQAHQAAITTLLQRTSQWGMKTWDYLADYMQYVKSITTYNNWVKEATTLIAQTWWENYDQRLVSYEANYLQWETDLTNWETCKQANPTPTNPPTPTPTLDPENPIPTPEESPTPVQPNVPEPLDCGDKPTKPERPMSPTLPRP